MDINHLMGLYNFIRFYDDCIVALFILHWICVKVYAIAIAFTICTLGQLHITEVQTMRKPKGIFILRHLGYFKIMNIRDNSSICPRSIFNEQNTNS